MYYANYRQLAGSVPPYPKTSGLGNDPEHPDGSDYFLDQAIIGD